MYIIIEIFRGIEISNRDEWNRYCEKIESALDSADIDFDEVETAQQKRTTQLKVTGVNVAGENTSKMVINYLGLPSDLDRAAGHVVQEITGETN